MRVLAGGCALAAAFVASAMHQGRAANAVVRAHQPIHEARYVRIGGIEQWIDIRGDDRTNPVLLILHGGPGAPLSPFANRFQSWEHDFTLVQWDQRGAGRTLQRAKPRDAAMTMARMTADGIELTQFLEEHLSKRRIAVLGFSFGSILGVRMIHERPELYAAYVGTGQVVNLLKGYVIEYKYLLDRAHAVKDATAIRELESLAPFPATDLSRDAYRTFNKWQARYEDDSDRAFEARVALPSAGATAPRNAPIDGIQYSQRTLGPEEIATTNLPALGYDFKVPVFFIVGASDMVAPTELSHLYLRGIRAPRKAFLEIPGGHYAFLSDPERFLAELRKQLAPVLY